MCVTFINEKQFKNTRRKNRGIPENDNGFSK